MKKVLWTTILICGVAFYYGVAFYKNSSFSAFSLVNLVFDNYLDQIGDIIKSHKSYDDRYDGEKCAKQLKYLKNGIGSMDLWAIKTIDSWSKIPTGLISGNIVDYGNYDQCVSIKHDSNQEEFGIFTGQFCYTVLKPILSEGSAMLAKVKNLTGFNKPNNADTSDIPGLILNFCLPDSCSPYAWQKVINSIVKPFDFIATDYDVKESCQTSVPALATKFEFFGITFFLISILIVIASTFYDLVMLKLNKEPCKILKSFSAFSNGKSLLNLEKSKSLDTIDCLYGVKAISLISIAYLHTYIEHIMIFSSTNRVAILDFLADVSSTVVMLGTLAVDSYFFVGGLLVTWHWLKTIEKDGKIKLLSMYSHRLLRIVPVLSTVILFIFTVLRFCGSGALWKKITNLHIENCQNNWWKSMLFISNYQKELKNCPVSVWYLSADMQLFICSPILLYIAYKYGSKPFYAVVTVLISISLGFNFYQAYFTGSNSTALLNGKFIDYIIDIYYATHIRMSLWLMGAALGTFFYKNKGQQIIIPKSILVMGWTFALILITASVVQMYNFQMYAGRMSLFKDSFIQMTTRNFWGLGLFWIILCCHAGYAGPINYFLTIPIWQPLSKLSLSIYLVHDLVIYVFSGIQRAPSYFSHLYLMYMFWAYFGTALFFGILWALIFEIPVTNLEKIWKTDNADKTDNKLSILNSQNRKILNEDSKSEINGTIAKMILNEKVIFRYPPKKIIRNVSESLTELDLIVFLGVKVCRNIRRLKHERNRSF